MLKRFVLVAAIAGGLCIAASEPLMGQSKEEVAKRFEEARALHAKAQSNEDLKRAAEKYEQLLKLFERVKFDPGIAAVSGVLGTLYADWGLYEKAIAYHQKGLQSSRRIPDPREELRALHSIGGIRMEQARIDEASDTFQEFLSLSRERGDRQAEGRALLGLGNVALRTGNYDQALSHLNHAAEIRDQLPNPGPEDEAALYLSLGILYRGMGQDPKAKENYEKAGELCSKLNMPRMEAKVLHNLANVYASWGQYDKAMQNYEKALALFRRRDMPHDVARSLVNMGKVYQNLDDSVAAMVKFKEGLAIYKRLGVDEGWAKELIAHLYLDLGHFTDVEPYVDWAGWHNTARARAYLLKLDYELAAGAYNVLLVLNEKKRNAEIMLIGYTGLGLALEGRSVYPKAEQYFRLAISQTEELRSSLTRSERERFFGVRSGGFPRTVPYKGLARVLLELDRPLEALKTSEATKARLFAEEMARRAEREGFDIPVEILKKDVHLNEKLATLKSNRQKARDNNDQKQGSEWDSRVEQAEAELASHIKDLRSKHPLFAATRYPQDIDLSQTALRDHEWALIYDVTEEGIIIYLTKGRRLVKALFQPMERKQLDGLVRKFREPLTLDRKELLAFDFETGKKLAEVLLEGVLSSLPKNVAVIIVPDDCLGILPFEALVLNEGGRAEVGGKLVEIRGAKFFGDRNPVSYHQSVTALTLARTLGKQQKPGEKVLALVDPVFSAEDERAKEAALLKKRAVLDKLTGETLMSIRTQLGGMEFRRLPMTGQLGQALKVAEPSRTDLFAGMDARKSVLLGKDLTPYQSVVFATHGYFGKDIPTIQEPVLVLTLLDQLGGQDGFLRMSEVMGLKLNCDVAALTACQTGLGRQISGEGTMGMGRAFQYAGARSVLMSLWSVGERSSVMLVERFFKCLREGKTKLEALNLARQHVRKEGYDHPFYWAPFILVGEGD